MIALFTMMTAWADPVVLRGPVVAPSASVGIHELSVGAPLPSSGTWSAALELRTDRGAMGASLGRRWLLRDTEGAWRFHAGVAGGVVVPLVDTSVGLTVTPWVSAGPMGTRGSFQGVIAMPVATSLRGGLRLPVLFELQGGVRAGPLWIVPRLGMGPVIAPGTDVSVATEGALMLHWAPPQVSSTPR